MRVSRVSADPTTSGRAQGSAGTRTAGGEDLEAAAENRPGPFRRRLGSDRLGARTAQGPLPAAIDTARASSPHPYNQEYSISEFPESKNLAGEVHGRERRRGRRTSNFRAGGGRNRRATANPCDDRRHCRVVVVCWGPTTSRRLRSGGGAPPGDASDGAKPLPTATDVPAGAFGTDH